MNIVIFLGAGASACFGMPTTKELFDILSNNKNMQFDEFLSAAAISTQNMDAEVLIQLMEDFEKLTFDNIHNKLSKVTSTSFIDDERHKRLEKFISKLTITKKIDYNNYCKCSTKIIRRIRNYINRSYSVSSNTANSKSNMMKLINSIWSPLLRYLNPDKNSIKIFTTNYDNVIDEYFYHSSYDFDDGFNRNRWMESFNPDTINYCKLHGSINWKYNKNKNMVMRIPHSHEQWPYRCMIYPSLLSKEDEYTNHPFTLMYDMFTDSIKNADLCIIIGSSFRDSAITNCFKLLSNNNSLFVIDSAKDFTSYIDNLKNNGICVHKSQNMPHNNKTHSVCNTHITLDKSHVYLKGFSDKTIHDICNFLNARQTSGTRSFLALLSELSTQTNMSHDTS